MHRFLALDRRHRRLLELVGAAAVIAAIVVVSLAATSGGSSAAPAFSPKQLASTPSDDWITNGGSISNDRYSALDQINTSNVAQLKGIWHVHLKSGVAAKYSGEAQPLEYKGVIYTITGADDVFAINATTGATKWVYHAQLNPKITTVCCGWTSRGVALGDGRVYLGQLDGKLVALDQQTGKVEWKTRVMPWQQGYTITSAPLYYDGRIYTGVSGADNGIRGRVTAYDAKNGKMLWRFYTIPGPGQIGHDTWPETGDAWKHGGASVWQTPAVDPDLGLLYFSTGNASPDFDGSARPGDDLFASSIVAIDAATGKYRWHFQEVHHDIWDYDAPSPVVLFNAAVNGQLVQGLGEPGKTGWEYLLDRKTGKPLYGITEKPVPQSSSGQEHTSPTQPFPNSGAFVPHTVSAAGLKAVRQAARATLGESDNAPKIVPGPFFSPPSRGGTIYASSPGALGGNDWPPSSYNPKTHLLYICGQTSVQANIAGTQAEGKPGEQQLGSTITSSGANNPGVIAAIDARSGRLVWERHLPDACYSGTVTTAGKLVFVGRNSGELQAYDATNGNLLWGFQTGAGANSTTTVFKHGGKEVVAFYAAGNALAGTAHGDNLWLFGLDGTLGPVAPGTRSTVQQHAGEAKAVSTVQVKGAEFFFKLSSRTAKLGKVTFVFKNAGHIAHDFAIAGKSTPVINPGQTAKLTVTFAKKGSYPYLCTVPGHASAGMKGVLRVG